jgi:hypothetical protein
MRSSHQSGFPRWIDPTCEYIQLDLLGDRSLIFPINSASKEAAYSARAASLRPCSLHDAGVQDFGGACT